MTTARLQSKLQRAFTLLEVMISGVVVSVGLLGIASLIPASKYQINEAIKADMAAQIGRAGLKVLITMTAPRNDFGGEAGAQATPNRDKTLANNIYGYNWDGRAASAPAVQDFKCSTDLVPNESMFRPNEDPPFYDPALRGNFAWVGTIRKVQEGYCEVSAAVCYRRPEAEISISGTHLGNNCFQLNAAIAEDTAKELGVGRWVYVYTGSKGHWYRIVDSSLNTDPKYLQLAGPHWGIVGAEASANQVTIRTPGGVIAVYTEVVPIFCR